MKATPAVLKSLRIIQAAPGVYPRQFAGAFFGKDHPGWKRPAKCGPKGTTRGGGLVLWAGGFLGKMYKAGLIAPRYNEFHQKFYFLTAAGRQMLKEDGRADKIAQKTVLPAQAPVRRVDAVDRSPLRADNPHEME